MFSVIQDEKEFQAGKTSKAQRHGKLEAIKVTGAQGINRERKTRVGGRAIILWNLDMVIVL